MIIEICCLNRDKIPIGHAYVWHQRNGQRNPFKILPSIGHFDQESRHLFRVKIKTFYGPEKKIFKYLLFDNWQGARKLIFVD